MAGPFQFSVESGSLCIAQFSPDMDLTTLLTGSGFLSITRTLDEVSVVAAEPFSFAGARVEGGWKAIKIKGPMDFALTGVLSAFLEPLAAACIPIFAISTFDTDYILVKAGQVEEAVSVLEEAGHMRFGPTGT